MALAFVVWYSIIVVAYLKRSRIMAKTLVLPPVQYIVEENGQRTGVVLGWEDYQTLQTALRTAFSPDPDLLVGISEPELQVLAEGILSSRHQERFNELLQRNREGGLSGSEEHEMDLLVERVDYMNTLKARAMYTLQWLRGAQEETLD
jgi:uncharacterized protein YnzC (UPF0291/DUF896 family)